MIGIMHDCILDSTWDTTKKNSTQEEMEEIFTKLPNELKYEAFEWGMNDTLWKDKFIEWYKKNM